MLGNMSNLKCYLKVWMQLGVGNSTRHLDVTTLCEVLGESVCDALPGFHVLMGCDYNPSFFGKGKPRPFNILRACEEYQQDFSSLGDVDISESSPAVAMIEKYVCDI